MRFIMPIILVGIAIAVFFVLSNPFYKDIMELRKQVASYDEALSNSKALESERDKLTAKYNAIDKDNLLKIQKLLPENIDNIRLILEIEQIAAPYGMALKDVKYNALEDKKTTTTSKATTTSETAPQGGGTSKADNKDYGVWSLSFSTTGTYSNFLNFTRDLESNLRIVDVSAIQFSSATTAGAGSTSLPSPDGPYKYDFTIKTYWLKN